jgi:hypothetical protein
MRVATKSIYKQFKLAFDPTGESTVTIRQAKSGDLVHMDNLFKEQTQIWDGDDFNTIQLKKQFNPQEVKRERAYLTLVAADIEDEEGNPIFRFKDGPNGPQLAMSRADFVTAWNELPPMLTEEIHDLVQAQNPVWNPAASGE